MKRDLSVRALALLFAVAICLAVATSGAARTAGPDAYEAVPPKRLTGATAELGKLRTKTWSAIKYKRERFGPSWPDVDGNGCDTRNDMLRRDLKNEVFQQGSTCKIQRGRLKDPYTGKVIAFDSARGAEVPIDHVVALKNAWQTGAAGWTNERRLRYANDPVVLLAVGRSPNSAKGDKDASQWLPSRIAYRCRFVAKQITIKAKYALWVTAAERVRMASVLAAC